MNKSIVEKFGIILLLIGAAITLVGSLTAIGRIAMAIGTVCLYFSGKQMIIDFMNREKEETVKVKHLD